MNEQTAEEKLRQTLEGRTPEPRRSSKTALPEDTGSFMEDFGKRIEQSLNVGVPSRKKIKNVKDVKEEKKKSKPVKTVTPSEHERNTVETKSEFNAATTPTPAAEIKIEPEQEHEPEIIKNVQAEVPLAEDSKPEVIEVVEEPETTNEPEPEIQEAEVEVPPEPEIIAPVMESEHEHEDEEPLNVHGQSHELPEIPLISDDDDENEISADEGFNGDEDNYNDNSNEDVGLPEIPVISDEEPQSQESREIFSPSADVVLNVAEEIPEQPDESEGESVPVSVAMPEDTKTAEDKLMADLAEAMTGNPLTLESNEPLEPYKIPEDFLSEVNSDPSKQSAEEKLISNIAEAMSESSLEAAADNAAKNFEVGAPLVDELENLDENLAASFPDREEPLTEEIDLSAYEADEPETGNSEELGVRSEELEENSEKPEPEIEPAFDEVPLPEPVNEPEPEPAEEISEISEIPEPEPENEIKEEASDTDNIINDSEEHDDGTSLLEEIPELQDAITTPENEEEEIMTTELSLSDEPEKENEGEKEEEKEAEDSEKEEEKKEEEEEYEFSLLGELNNTEEPKEDDMPEQSLIEEENHEAEHEAEESFDMGFLGDAVSFGEHEHEEDIEDLNGFGLEDKSETESENKMNEEEEVNNFGFDENSPSHGGFINPDPGEEEEKEKVMGLREKVTKRIKVNKNPDGESTGRSGIIMPLLLIALLCVGGFIAWQLMQLNKNLSANTAGADINAQSQSAGANPSYEYAVDFIFDSNLNGRMSQRGQEGWQVVGSRRTQDSITGQLGYEFIFMRKAPVK